MTLPACEDFQWHSVAGDFPTQQIFYAQVRGTRYPRGHSFVHRFHLGDDHSQREVRFVARVPRRWWLEPTRSRSRFLGPITPLGGVFMVAG